MTCALYRRTIVLLGHFSLQTLLQTAIEPHQHQQCTEGTHASAHARAACGEGQTVRHEKVSKNQHRNDARKLLHNLRHRCRRHNLPSLQIAAEACQKGYEENSRSQCNNRIVSAAVADDMIINQPVRAEKQR